MKPFYPELEHNREFIAKVIAAEEERFNRTLVNGLKIFDDLLQAALENKQALLSGATCSAFPTPTAFPWISPATWPWKRASASISPAFQRALKDQKERSRLSLQEKRKDDLPS